MVNHTGRLKAEEERRRLSTAVEQSSEAIAITHPEDRILYVNQTFQTLHGIPGGAILDGPMEIIWAWIRRRNR